MTLFQSHQLDYILCLVVQIPPLEKKNILKINNLSVLSINFT